MGVSGCGIQEEGGWDLGSLRASIQGDTGFSGVQRRETTSSPEERKHIVIGAMKWSKTLSGNEICEDLIKEETKGDILFGYEDFLLKECGYVDE